MTFEEKRKNLVDNLIKRKILTNSDVINAMLKVPREKFLPDKAVDVLDEALLRSGRFDQKIFKALHY